MKPFNSIRELIWALANSEALITALFERLTFYCRMITLFPDEIAVSENYAVQHEVEYALANPSTSNN